MLKARSMKSNVPTKLLYYNYEYLEVSNLKIDVSFKYVSVIEI